MKTRVYQITKYYPRVYNTINNVIEANNKTVGSFNGHHLSLDVNVSNCFLSLHLINHIVAIINQLVLHK